MGRDQRTPPNPSLQGGNTLTVRSVACVTEELDLDSIAEATSSCPLLLCLPPGSEHSGPPAGATALFPLDSRAVQGTSRGDGPLPATAFRVISPVARWANSMF